ncbi:phosphate signaling complex PhoU family protein [Methanobrevibacter filiformis]|uniref:Transcriptional regulator PhoU n=1 Tax=Methanobrevibacter filiformis TaxID=55758 RepID=A0A166AX15_9EURY|nr:PhoU domain-containing protein [Methanobrevibacter filiformis]KZX12576.1 transcriptional regulator PhoU [Methanobrevibacter filiformis]
MNNKSQKITKGNRTLKDIMDLIYYQNPSTQDEIAEKLGITRRYVTKLIQPLVKEGVIKRSYTIDFKKLEEHSELFTSFDSIRSQESSTDTLIKKWLHDMVIHVQDQLKLSVTSIIQDDFEKANQAIEMDKITNNFFDKIRTSIQTIMTVEPHSDYARESTIHEICFDVERIGDYCCRISRFTIGNFNISDDLKEIVSEMHDIAQKMIECSLYSFIKEKYDHKHEILELERKLNRLEKISFETIDNEMVENSRSNGINFEYFRHLLQIIISLERIGNICTELTLSVNEFYFKSSKTLI